MTPPPFRGAAYVEHIRTRLWNGGASGRATVMVGAGFSRNALPSSPSAPPFPLLKDYRATLAAGLGLPAGVAAQLPLERLAGEYEASFGREALNDVITRLIPWRQYGPGPLHRLLLELPWADVFTTNYDQLLEETRALVTERKYDLVLHPDDVPTATPPRIVKLHGSFPSTRPFIFTEEDFRGYPRRFAPFVNLVQQGMMEHTLCLLGFSGDDPNFLRWAGWVRDELGLHRPQIYLVGVLDLPDGRRRYLEQLGISPVDLAELFPWRADQDGGLRHQQANEWFLRSLVNGEPPDRRRWPSGSRRVRAHNLSLDPLPFLSPHDIPEPHLNEEGRLGLGGAFQHARARRLAYPGWEVCPPGKGEGLHLDTQGWFGVNLILDAVEQPSPLDLLIAREGVWQLAVTGDPLTPQGVQALDTLLGRTSHVAERGQADVTLPVDFSSTGHVEPLPWMEVKTAWVECAFAQLTEAREDMHAARFSRWAEALRDALGGHPNWEARWHWEGVRWSITRLDRQDALERLKSWPAHPSDPFWEARRAAALAEVGDINAALELNLTTLNRVRTAQVPGHADYRMMSQEAWLMTQARFLAITQHQRWKAEEVVNERRIGRLLQLRQYDCDPWGDIDFLKSRATAALRTSEWGRGGTPAERQFDVGRVRRTYTAEGELPTPIDPRPALRMLRLCEWAAYPLRAGRVSFGARELTPALLPLTTAALCLSVLTAIRAGAGDALQTILSRDTVTEMLPEDVTVLIDILLTALNQAEQAAGEARERIRYEEHDFSYQILQHGMEALSRLMLRGDHRQRQEALELAIRLAGVHAVQWDSTFYEPLGNLLRRSVQAMTDRQKLGTIALLAGLPIPPENVRYDDRWPDPFEDQEFPVGDAAELSALPAQTLPQLMAHAATPPGHERRTALLRLASVYRLGLLDTGEQQAFGDTLWRDRDTHGLPHDTPFHRFAFLHLPYPSAVEPAALLKTHYLQGSFAPVVDKGEGFSLGNDGPLSQMHRDLYSLKVAPLPWTPEDVQTLLLRLQTWWPTMSQLWQVVPREWINRGDATLLLDVLGGVLLPHAGPHAGAVLEFQREVEERFQALGIPVTPSAVLNTPGAIQTLLDAVLSSTAEEVRTASHRAARAIQAELQPGGVVPAALSELRTALLARVICRAGPALDAPLQAMASLVAHGLALTLEERRQVLLCLHHLAHDTEHRPGPVLSGEARSERAEWRASASALAAALHSQTHEPVEDTLLTWAAIGQNDPLPEVRQPWQRGAAQDRDGPH